MRNLECFFSLDTKKEFVYVREKGGERERLRERKREWREKREAETLTQERESETQIN